MLMLAVLVLLAVPALLTTGYLAILTLFSLPQRAPARAPRTLRFDVIVPAHDEEAGVARTVRNLLALDWPADRFRVIVVADNCSDRTGERAVAEGATVLVRRDDERRGKGYALQFAFARVLADGFADAAVVVDADTLASRNMLAAFAARLGAGAHAVQADYGVLNPDASWRTRLIAIAFALFHNLRSLGRERLGVSCGLRGNGMCFSADVLRRVPHSAFSIVEDVEYGIRLGRAGVRIHYAAEARVLGEMVSRDAAARSQRRRWEGGRMEIVRLHGFDLLEQGLRGRDRLLLDLALDVLIPPLSWIAAYTALGTGAVAMLTLGGAVPAWTILPWLLPCAFLVAYVLRGVQLSGMGLRGVASLAWVPAYMLWKLVLLLPAPREKTSDWVRTARERETHSTIPG